MVDEADRFLLDWANNYFASRDAIQKNIISIEERDNTLKLTYKDREELVIVKPELNSLKDSELKDNLSIITLNNRKNLDFLYTKWSSLIAFSLKIYFINPFSATDRRWIINPKVHAMICDEASLKTGLVAMFETVEPLTLEMLSSKAVLSHGG